jgi:ABC-type transporter Mla subunit MlaD
VVQQAASGRPVSFGAGDGEVGGIGPTHDAADAAVDIGDSVDEVADINGEVADFIDDVADMNDEVVDFNDDVGDINDEVVDLIDEVVDMNDEVADLIDEVGDINDEVANLIDEVGDINDEVADLNDDVNDVIDEVIDIIDGTFGLDPASTRRVSPIDRCARRQQQGQFHLRAERQTGHVLGSGNEPDLFSVRSARIRRPIAPACPIATFLSENEPDRLSWRKKRPPWGGLFHLAMLTIRSALRGRGSASWR